MTRKRTLRTTRLLSQFVLSLSKWSPDHYLELWHERIGNTCLWLTCLLWYQKNDCPFFFSPEGIILLGLFVPQVEKTWEIDYLTKSQTSVTVMVTSARNADINHRAINDDTAAFVQSSNWGKITAVMEVPVAHTFVEVSQDRLHSDKIIADSRELVMAKKDINKKSAFFCVSSRILCA